MNFSKLPLHIFLICLLLLITRLNASAEMMYREDSTQDSAADNTLSKQSSLDLDKKLKWFYDKSKGEQITLSEAMKTSFKAYKSCDSHEMIKEMGKSPYDLEKNQIQELCEDIKKEVKKQEKQSAPPTVMTRIQNMFSSKNPVAKTKNKGLSVDILSMVGDYVENNHDLLNLSLANKRINKNILEPRKLDKLDPIRFYVKKVSPQLFNYFDGKDLGEFSEKQKIELFDDVHTIFEQVVNGNNIQSILKEHAEDLFDYIKNKKEYDPKTHYDLYNKYVQKMQNGCVAHQGFHVEDDTNENLPMGTYYNNVQIHPDKLKHVKRGNFVYGGRSLEECVVKCKKNPNCNACTLASSLINFKMLVNYTTKLDPEKDLVKRDTYHYMGVWIKDNYKKKSPPKVMERIKRYLPVRKNKKNVGEVQQRLGVKNTKFQEQARMNKEISKLIDQWSNDKDWHGYVPPTLLKKI